MLFISRYVRNVDSINYGLVDTETGDEEIADWSRIWRLTIKHGVPIAGVSIVNNTVVMNVYQEPATVTLAQIKLKMLRHVDIKTYNGMITSIKWDINMIKSPVHVRLSDFGAKCADYCMYENEGHADGLKVVIIFDNKVTFNKTFFDISHVSNLTYHGVAFDFYELNDENAAKAYTYLYTQASRGVIVRDIPDRYKRFGLTDHIVEYIGHNIVVVDNPSTYA